MTALSRRVDEPDNVVRGKDVGCAPGLLRAAIDSRRQFVGSILGTDVPGEANHVAEAAGALINRSRQSRPLDGGSSAHVVFPSRIGEGGKTS
jgi:hypothetical protein